MNNFLIPEDIKKTEAPLELLNTVTPTSTTSKMAGEQPIRALPIDEQVEAQKPTDIALLNTVTPTSTTAQLAGQQPIETRQKHTEAPLEDLPKETPSGSDIPGGFPITPANELDKFFGVNPLPAAEGGVNPITLAPGEKVPETIAAQNLHSNVKLDKESYEKSDAIPGLPTDLPPVSKNTIPESSLPISGFQDNTLSSVAPTSTTAALAGQVPVESHVPEVVRESQQKAHVAPDASVNPLEVHEKAQVEEELKEKVPVAPATSEGTAVHGTDKSENDVASNLAALAATAGGAVIAAGIAIRDTVQEQAAPIVSEASKNIQETAAPYITTAAETAHHELPESVKQSLPVSAQDAIAERAAQAQEERIEEISPEVPAEVNASIVAARQDPEAAANTEAVEEKRLVEQELLQHVKPVAAGDHTKDSDLAPSVPAGVKDSFAKSGESPEAAAHTQAVEEKRIVEQELREEVKPVAATHEAKDSSLAPTVPVTVQDSILESGKNPEAAGNTEAVQEKSAVEQELLKEVKPVPAVDETTQGVKSHESKPETTHGSTSLAPEHIAPVVVSKDAPKTETEPAEAKSDLKPLDLAPAENAPVLSAYDAVTSQDSEPVTTQNTESLSTQQTEPLSTQHTEPILSEPVETKAKEPIKSDEPVEPQVSIPKTEELGTKVPQREVTKPESSKAKEPVTEQPKSDVAETKAPKTENKTITPVTNIENGSSATDTKPAETKAAEPANAANGSSANKKKHNRLSSIFSKIKHKLTDK